jgi:hypothetical protein
METKFTPGPWLVSRDGRNVGHFGDDMIALTANTAIGGASINEQQANAHLIAAAPDLYHGINALLGLLTLVANRDDMPEAARDALTKSHRIDEANAALKKARGES